MPKKIVIVGLLLTILLYSSCNYIGDRNYKISDLNGIYVIRNYLDDGCTIGPSNHDTLFVCDGRFRNIYYGLGTCSVIKDRCYNEILVKYSTIINPKAHGIAGRIDTIYSGSGLQIEQPLWSKDILLMINSDLNYYYERISKNCPDIFNE